MFPLDLILETQGNRITEKIKTLPFTVAKNPDFLPNAAARNRNIHLLQQAKDICAKPTAAGIAKIKTWMEMHPDLPEFTNYLAVAYERMGMHKEFQNVIMDSQARYPDYLFAQTNAASVAMLREDVPLAGKFIAEGRGVEHLYPNRTQFLDAELCAYLDSACRYLNAIDAIEDLETLIFTYYTLLKHDPHEKQKIQKIYNTYIPSIVKYRLEKIKSKSKKSDTFTVIKNFITPKFLSNDAPNFKHTTEMQWLYENGYDIAPEKLTTILALPPKTLIADLILVMQDSIKRHKYWSEEVEYSVETHTFSEHAFVLLATLKSPAALENLLDIMAHDDDFTDFWISDWLNDWLDYAMSHIGADCLPLIAHFLQQPNVNGLNIMSVLKSLSHFVKTYPECLPQCTDMVTNALLYILDNPDDASRVNTEASTSCVMFFMDTLDTSKLPLIKRAFDSNLVDEGIVGDWDTVEAEINEASYTCEPLEMKTMEAYYADKMWIMTSSDEEYDDEEDETIWEAPKPISRTPAYTPPIVNTTKIGRNDPCSCGSGKKYKKCCG